MTKKVLFLITKSNWGGAQRYVYDLATKLPRDEFEVAVAVGGGGLLIRKLREADVRVIVIPSLQRDVSLAKESRALLEIWRIVRSERPDVLHINSSKAGAFGAIIGRMARVPRIIFTAHGWAFNEDRPWWQRMVLKKIHWFTVLLSDRTIAVSHELRRQMNWPLASAKMVVIHNGRAIENPLPRDGSRSYLIQKEPRLAPYRDDFWSMTIAELHPIKRHLAIIEAVKQASLEKPNLRHLIIGAGEEEAKIRKAIAENGLTENVFLLGAIDEAARYLKATDVFILASRSEAFAYALIEACLAGIPSIATAVGGLPEIVEHEKNGLLIPVDDKSLFEAILRLYTDEGLRSKLAEGARSSAHRFSFADTLTKTADLYRG